MASACMCEPACENTYSDVAQEIKQASETYVEEYWNKRAGKNVNENERIEKLLERIEQTATSSKEGDKEKAMRIILDTVAKHNMSTYYNMLLPQVVCKSVLWYSGLVLLLVLFVAVTLNCFYSNIILLTGTLCT